MTSRKPPPAPLYVVRTHESSITRVSLNNTSQFLVSSDDDGVVAITSIRTMRYTRRWAAHGDSVLSIEWTSGERELLTHGRDNLVKVWKVGDVDIEEDTPPVLAYEFHVNALNFCNVSLCTPGWLAAPHLADSARIDIWELPSRDRLYRSIGDGEEKAVDGRGEAKTGLCMALKLYEYVDTHRLLAAYEDGSLVQFELQSTHWKQLWRVRKHKEAVMGLCITDDSQYAYTVSVDKYIVKYDLERNETDESVLAEMTPKIATETQTLPIVKSYTTQSNGHSSVSVRKDGRVLAVGCWNGNVELYSSKSMKLVGVLDMHRQSVSSVSFSTVQKTPDTQDTPSNSVIEAPPYTLLVTGGRDDRVAIYQIDL